jgi:hypothetical protein
MANIAVNGLDKWILELMGDRNEGLPPSAADKDNGTFDNPIYPGDCAEAEMLNSDARPGWQARVRSACGEN